MSRVQQLSLSIAAFVILAFAFFCDSLYVLHTCSDAGWLIRTGEYVFQHGIPLKDMFTWTNADCPLIAYQWLFSACLWLLFQSGSLWLVGLAACLLAGVFVLWLLPAAWMRRGIPAFVPFSFLVLALTPTWFNVRPQLCSFFFVYAFVAILERYREAPEKKKLLFALPALLTVWANLHLFCFAGIFAVAVYFLSSAIRKKSPDIPLLLVLIASVPAVLLNPYGIGLLSHFFSFADNSQYLKIYELMPWFASQQYWWTLLYAPLVAAIVFRQRKQVPPEGFILMGTALAAAILMIRFEPVFVIVSWFYLGPCLAAINWKTPEAGVPEKRSSKALCAAAFMVSFLSWCLQCPNGIQPWINLTDGSYPFLSVITKNYLGEGDRVFVPAVVGSWLIAMGKYPVFMDTRYDMYPKTFVQETTDLVEGRRLDSLEKWKIDKLIVNDDYVLTLKLLNSPDWQPVLDDGVLSLWNRNSDSERLQLEAWGLADEKIASAQLPPYIIDKTIEFRCVKYLQMAKMYRQQGQMDAAREAVASGLRLMPRSPGLLKEKEGLF